MLFKLPLDTQDRLRVNRRAIERGSATPPRFLNDHGRFINGYCYLEVIPEEWKSSVAMTCGKFASLSMMLALMQHLWSDYALVLGPTRDWRITFGSKIVPPRPGEHLLLHIERNGVLTFDEMLELLMTLLAHQLDIVVGGDDESHRPLNLNRLCVGCLRPAGDEPVYDAVDLFCDLRNIVIHRACAFSTVSYERDHDRVRYVLKTHIVTKTGDILPIDGSTKGYCWLKFFKPIYRQCAANNLDSWAKRRLISIFRDVNPDCLSEERFTLHIFRRNESFGAHLEPGYLSAAEVLDNLNDDVEVGGDDVADGSVIRGVVHIGNVKLPSWVQHRQSTVNRIPLGMSVPAPVLKPVAAEHVIQNSIPSFSLRHVHEPKKQLILSFRTATKLVRDEVDEEHSPLACHRVGPLNRQGRARVCVRCERTPKDRIKNWFVLSCVTLGLDQQTHCPMCKDMVVDSHGSSTHTVVSHREVKRVCVSRVVPANVPAKVVTYPVLNTVPAVIDLPLLPSPEEGNRMGFVVNGFSLTQQRITATQPKRIARVRDQRRIVAASKPDFAMPTIYSTLTSENIGDFRTGSAIHERCVYNDKPRKHVNRPGASYFERKLAIKRDRMFNKWAGRGFITCTAKRSQERLTMAELRQFVSTLTERQVKSVAGFRYYASVLAKRHRCPLSRLTVRMHDIDGVVFYTIQRGGPYRGLTFRTPSSVIGHMGYKDDTFGIEISEDTPPIDDPCELCDARISDEKGSWCRCPQLNIFNLRPFCAACVDEVQMIHDRLAASKRLHDIDDEFVSFHQRIIDNTILNTPEQRDITADDVLRRLQLERRDLLRCISTSYVFLLMYNYKSRFGCPGRTRVTVNFSTMDGDYSIMVADRSLYPGLYFTVDGFSLFHAGVTEHISSVVTHSEREKNQHFLDETPLRGERLRTLDKLLVEAFVINRAPSLISGSLNATMILSLLHAYKSQYGCPALGADDGLMFTVHGISWLAAPKEHTGLWFGLNGEWLYHAGVKCQHERVTICSNTALKAGLTESSCGAADISARSLIIVRRPKWRYALTGHKISFNVNDTVVVTRRTNIFRFDGDKTIGLKQNQLFWSTPVLYLTMAGLKRFYLEKRSLKGGAFVVQMARSMDMTVRAFHEFMESVSVELRFPDVVSASEDVHAGITSLEKELTETREFVRDLSDQVRDLAVCAQMTAPHAKTLTTTFKVADAVSKFEATPRIAQRGHVKHTRSPSVNLQHVFRSLALSPTREKSHKDITVDGDVEKHPGPVSRLDTDVPIVSLVSPTPTDYMQRMRRRTVSDRQNDMTYLELINDVTRQPRKQKILRDHLSQRVKDCHDKVAKHCLWREKWLRVDDHGEFKDVILSTIKREDTLFHAFISSAALAVDPNCQFAVETIGIMTHCRVDKTNVEHIAADLQRCLVSYARSYDRDEVVHFAITWKACRGCPSDGMISVMLNTSQSQYAIRWTHETPTTGGQINWMVDGVLFAHCGADKDRGRTHNRNLSAPSYAEITKGRSRSVSRSGNERLTVAPGFQETISRAVSPLRSKISRDTRLMTILGAKRFGLDDFFSEGETKEYLRKRVLDQPGEVETIWASLDQSCDTGVKESSSIVHIQHRPREWDTAMIFESVPCAYPEVQRYIDWIGKHKEQNDIIDVDPRGSGDFVNGVYGAFGAAAPGMELCSVIGMALAWKKRWGCPKDEYWAITCMPSRREWTIHTFDDYKARTPGLYWFWNGELVCHCGSGTNSRYLPTIPSPYDMTACTTRHEPILDGHVPLTMRHKDQHAGVRNYQNPGMHSLPLDFLEDVDREQAPWHNDVLEFIKYVHACVEHFAKTYGHEYITVTANMNHDRCPWPVVNFLSSGREEVEVVSAKRVNVHTRFNGLCLRGIRMFPCFFPSRVKAFLIANGPLADWQNIIPLSPTDALEMPKCRIWWLGAYAVNNMWIRPDFLTPTVSLRQWITPLTVYGGDEVILSHVHVNTVLDHVPGMARPFLGVIPYSNYPINVTYWTMLGNKVGSYTMFNPAMAHKLYSYYCPGRPVIDKNLHVSRHSYQSFADLRTHPKMIEARAHLVRVTRETMIREQRLHELSVSQITPGWSTYTHNPAPTKDLSPEQALSTLDHTLLFCYAWYLFIWLRLWLRMYIVYNRSWTRPRFPDGDHEWVSESSEEFPSHMNRSQLSGALCIQTLGTRGDVEPIKYLANVAANAGVPVHIIHRYRVQTHELEALRDGKVMHLAPAQLDLMYSDRLGYKATFQPHVTVAKGGEYSLAPPRKWINKVRFSDRFETLDVVHKATVMAMDIFSALQRPLFHIGSLDGCSIPRALNGCDMLEKRTNRGRFAAGWISGSASSDVIPAYIKDKYPEIPRGDHQEIFRDYAVIHCHGGAGTMQTAIACGARAISHDATLDRAYKRALTPTDFKQPSLWVFYGWLISRGYQLRMPWLPFLRSWFAYTWFSRWNHLKTLGYALVKIYLLGLVGFVSHATWMLVFVSLPGIVWRVMETYGNINLVKQVLRFLWAFPFVLYYGKINSIVLIAMHFDLPLLILQDVVAWWKNEFSLIYEPVTHHRITTVYPVGHYAVRDNRTGVMYEGRFTGSRRVLGETFTYRASNRLPHDNAIIIPVQANLLKLQDMVDVMTGSYSPAHNCATLAHMAIKDRSGVVAWMVSFATVVIGVILSGGWVVQEIIQKWDNTFNIRESRFFHLLGFAAEQDDIPFELEPLADAPLDNATAVVPVAIPQPGKENIPVDEIDPPLRELTDPNLIHDLEQVNSEECLPELIKCIATITAVIAKNTPEEDHDIVFEAGKRALADALSNQELPDDPITLVQPLPPYMASSWQEVRESIHEAFLICKQTPFVSECLMYVQHIEDAVEEIVVPLTKLLFYLLRKVYDFGKDALQKAWDAVCRWLDFAFGEETSTRVKTVWGPTGLWKTSYLDPTRDLLDNLQMSSFVGKTTFLNDYQGLVDDLKRHAETHKVAKMNMSDIGGPQFRKVNLKTPMMSHNEARMLGMKEGEYHNTDHFEEYVNNLLRDGVPQGSDGVIYAQRNPDAIDKSFARYEHQYSREYPKGQEMKMLKAADTVFETFNSSWVDSQVVSMVQVTKQLKLKYSAGVPFLHNKSTKTRQMLQDKGFLDTFQSLAKEYLRTGKFPVEFFHGFEKSQVVDLGKLLGGKNVRTVVANFLLTTYMEHIFQLDRNKRETWMETGLGSGMPLNQSMARIWEEIADRMKHEGGRLMIMDATQYDSAVAPIAFAGLARLDELSFKDHPSGKGKEIASVFKAKYDAVQQAWILGITRPKTNTLCIGSDDPESYDLIVRQKIPNLVPIDNYDPVKHEGKVVLVRARSQAPVNTHWNGMFRVGNPNDMDDKDWPQGPPHIYRSRHWRDMIKDVNAIVLSNRDLTSRVFSKDQGIATGFTSVTHSNSWSYRLCLMCAWSDTTGLPVEDFFKHNTVKNTGDDALWLATLTSRMNSIKNIYLFQQNCRKYGVTLELETTRDITKAEYLSKTVTPPTQEDADDIKNWKMWKLRSLAQAGKDVTDEELLANFNNPRFIVKQNPKAIKMRATAVRYYQGSEQKYLYTMITRDAGHANVTAFRRGLYCSIAQSYCDSVNLLLKQHNIHQRWELRWEELKGGSSVRMPHVIQVNPRWVEQKLSPRQMAVVKYVKQQAKFPSYLKVIDVHMNIKTPDPQGHAKFLAKLAKGTKGWDSAARDVCDWLVTVTNQIPTMFADRFMPGVQAIFPDNPFYTKNDWVSKFTMSTILNEMPESEIDYPLFQARVGEGPYGAITNTLLFWEKWQDAGYRENFYQKDHRLFQSMCLMISLVYSWTYFIDIFVGSLTLLGPMWRLYTWSYWGLRTIYGISNTVYWHSKGKSSRTISSLMPKDQYIVSKRFSAVVVDFIPVSVGYLLYPLTYINDLLTQPFELSARIFKKGNEMKPVTVKHDNIFNPWIDFATHYVEKLEAQPNRRLYISAPTGTGKSTFFPAAILGTKHKNLTKRIWLVLPRLILRDEWSIPFNIPSQVLKKGVRKDKRADIYLCTYGHFLNRLSEVDVANDIVLFDEFHEQTGEMILAESKCAARIALLSATPVNLPSLKNTPTVVPSIKKRFATKIHKFDDERTVIQMFQVAKNIYPDLINDTLIIVPTKAEVRTTIVQLQWLGHTATELSSSQRNVPRTGIIVATPYVDVGLDIKPARSMLIDSGQMIAIDRGKKVRGNPPTDPSRNKQRIGRVGRLRDGIVFQNKLAGTGESPVQYPAGWMFEHEVISRVYSLPQLTPLPNSVPGCPYLFIDPKKIGSKPEQKSLLALHLIALSGERDVMFERVYNKLLVGDRLGEEQWWINDRIYRREWNRTDMLPWEEALSLLAIPKAVAYGINGSIEYRTPIQPVHGVWHDCHLDTNAYEEPFADVKDDEINNTMKLDRVRGILKKLEKQLASVTQDVVKTTILADVSRVTASILQA